MTLSQLTIFAFHGILSNKKKSEKRTQTRIFETAVNIRIPDASSRSSYLIRAERREG